MAAKGQAAALVIVSLLVPSAVAAQCSLKDLSWLIGAWHGRNKSREVQEHWAAASSGQLMGLTWNTNDSGRDDVIAVQTIFEKGSRLSLRQRFFDLELARARDQIDTPISFTASSCRPDFVEFQADEKWAGYRVTYTRVGDALSVDGIAGHNGGLGHFAEKMSKE